MHRALVYHSLLYAWIHWTTALHTRLPCSKRHVKVSIDRYLFFCRSRLTLAHYVHKPPGRVPLKADRGDKEGIWCEWQCTEHSAGQTQGREWHVNTFCAAQHNVRSETSLLHWLSSHKTLSPHVSAIFSPILFSSRLSSKDIPCYMLHSVNCKIVLEHVVICSRARQRGTRGGRATPRKSWETLFLN